MLIVFILTVILGSFFSLTLSNSRINHQTRIANEARNAAQSISEVALSEANRRAQSYSTLSSDFLSSYVAATGDITFLTSSGSNISPTSLGVKAGNLSPLSSNVTLVADDPMYKGDLLSGATLKVRNGFIYSTATAINPNNGLSNAYYFRQLIQVREQSWIDYGIFYNMDLEFHAGPEMDIFGPVHTNADAYVAAGGTLEFYDKFTAAGRIYRKIKYNDSKTSHAATVKSPKEAGSTSSSLVTWPMDKDSSASDWASYAGTRWNYFVRDSTFPSALRPPRFAPKDLPAYTPENFSTADVELRNSAYAMIEPQLSTDNSNSYHGSKAIAITGTPTTWDYDPENLKFSALSGFTIRCVPATAGNPIPWRIIYYATPSTTFPVDKVNLPTRGPSGMPIENVINPNHPDMDDRLRAQLIRAIRYVPFKNTDGSAALVGTPWATGANAGTIEAITSTSTTAPRPSRRLPVGPDPASDYPIYDRRQGYQHPNASAGNLGFRGAFHCVIIDMRELNILINLPSVCWEKVSTRTTGPLQYWYEPDSHWSNIVYVDTGLSPAIAGAGRMASGGDKIRTAIVPDSVTIGTAVVLRNARNLPQLGPAFTASKRTPGFTIATNGPVYIHGHYNSDGSLSTGSSSVADPSDTTTVTYDVSLASAPTPATTVSLPTFIEQPALIAGDSVTVLSRNFSFVNSATNKGDAANTEISAAIMTGLVPTRPGFEDVWAGGVHNLIRYLEDWSDKTYRYRGSIIALYESEVAKQPWRQGTTSWFNYWYSPPERDVGYHPFFVQGRIPPGIPIVRTLRRMNMERIDRAIYDAAVPTPPKVE
jgi:hypothetical protein